jgi:DHA1 family bicyclomycin/chloramphenicol resistance-like MFS transporter
MTERPDLDQPHRGRDTLPVAILLTGAAALAPLTTDIFLPSMPEMAAYFASDVATLQLGVTLFLACFAASQLIFGTLSDRYGRRPVLLFGLGLFTLGGVVCMAAGNVVTLLSGRVIQGIAAGSGPSVGRAVVRDIYGRERAAQVLSYMAVAQSLAPMLAPVIGGYLQTAFGWRSIFVALVVLGGILLLSYLVSVPETNPHRDPAALRPRRLLENYGALLTDRTYLAYALVSSLLLSGQFVFITSSAFVLIGGLGLSPERFGFAFGFASFGLMAGAYLAGRLSRRLGINALVVGGSVLALAAAGLMTGVTWAGGGLWGLLLPMFFYSMSGGIVRPPATAGAINPWPHMAGVASALLGFLQMAAGSAYAVAFGLVFDGTSQRMAEGISVAAVAALASLLLLVPGRPRPRTGLQGD